MKNFFDSICYCVFICAAFLFLGFMLKGEDAPQCVDQKAEVERLNKLVTFYRDAYFTILQDRIEQKIAPKATPK